MSAFRKREDCPASEVLLEYQSGKLTGQVARAVGGHLRVCEFCSAEVLFYERYPACDDDSDTPALGPDKMPEPLYELAEAILNRRLSPQVLARIRSEIDSRSSEPKQQLD